MTESGQSADPVPPGGILPVYEPAQAAEILRSIGLTGMTECALRTRAYRKQVPFHRNGRRITFTLDDLREIAEGEAQRPQPRAPRDPATAERPARRGARRRRSHADSTPTEGAWRARRTFDG